MAVVKFQALAREVLEQINLVFQHDVPARQAASAAFSAVHQDPGSNHPFDVSVDHDVAAESLTVSVGASPKKA